MVALTRCDLWGRVGPIDSYSCCLLEYYFSPVWTTNSLSVLHLSLLAASAVFTTSEHRLLRLCYQPLRATTSDSRRRARQPLPPPVWVTITVPVLLAASRPGIPGLRDIIFGSNGVCYFLPHVKHLDKTIDGGASLTAVRSISSPHPFHLMIADIEERRTSVIFA